MSGFDNGRTIPSLKTRGRDRNFFSPLVLFFIRNLKPQRFLPFRKSKKNEERKRERKRETEKERKVEGKKEKEERK